MTRLLPDAGVKFIQQEEGLRTVAYQDQGGVWTIGYGHTGSDVHEGLVITIDEAIKLMRQDFDKFCAAVDTLCPGSNDNEFSGMVSLAFNIGEGVGGFNGSSVMRNWNAGKKLAAADSIELWNKSKIDGVLQVNPVLVGRRAREKALFLTPVGAANINIAATDKPMAQAVAPPPSAVSSKTVLTTVVAGAATAASVADQVGPAINSISKVNDTVTGVMPTIGHLLRSPLVPVVLGIIVIGLLLFVGIRYVIKMRRGEIKSV